MCCFLWSSLEFLVWNVTFLTNTTRPNITFAVNRLTVGPDMVVILPSKCGKCEFPKLTGRIHGR